LPDAPLPRLRLNADDLACVRGGRPVFAHVSFALRPGELLALAGPNGAGKSSLIRMVAGLLPPASGKLAIEVEPDDEAPPFHLIAYADGLKPQFTLRDNLAFWRTAYGGAGDDEGAIFAAAEAVGLDHALDLRAAVLSSGQRRRASLARLCLSPRPLWLLDEPTATLDKGGEAMLGRLMRDHLARGGAILAATHLDLPVPPTATLRLG